MAVTISVKYLAEVKSIEIDPSETLDSLKDAVEKLYNIPSAEQSLMHEGRNISTSTKTLGELGVKQGGTIIVKKIHKFTGVSRGFDVSTIMKNPMVKGMMKNPETIKTIQNMFPELKEEMLENKTLNMMLNNGGFEEEIEKMTLDGDYMSTQLRNADVTMAKLENIPGGINMMSGMIKDVEDPFRIVDPAPRLVGGEKIEKKITVSIPGTSRKNSLVEYRRQLTELKDIGFDNMRENVEVLCRVNGDVQAALDILVERHKKS